MRLKFKDSKKTKSHLKTLALYVPVVARVHGGSHPEFYEVSDAYDRLVQKIKSSGSGSLDLTEEFDTLRSITSGYTVPDDVCESYQAVYDILQELDNAYRAL